MVSTRRSVLETAAVGLGGILAGCTGRLRSSAADSPPQRAAERLEGAWPTNDGDATNDRRADVPGVTVEPTQRWERTVPGRVFGDPVVADSLVFCNGEVDGPLSVLEAATGETYRTADDVRLHGAPSIVDGTLYCGAATDGQRVTARDPATGEHRWSRSVEKVPRSPAVVDGTVYSSTVPDGGVYAFESDADADRWRYETVGVSSAVAVGSGTVALTAGGHAFALDSETGERRWNVRLDDPPAGLHGPAPVLASGRIVVGTNAAVVGFDRDGETVWSVEASGEGPPSIGTGDGVVYVGTGTGVTAVDADSGERLWTATEVAGGTSLTVTETVLYACDGRTLSAVDRSGGTVRWTKRLDERIGLGLAALEDALVVVTGVDPGPAEEPTSTVRAFAPP